MTAITRSPISVIPKAAGVTAAGAVSVAEDKLGMGAGAESAGLSDDISEN